jgi:hypothetical protein
MFAARVMPMRHQVRAGQGRQTATGTAPPTRASAAGAIWVCEQPRRDYRMWGASGALPFADALALGRRGADEARFDKGEFLMSRPCRADHGRSRLRLPE